MDTKNSLFSSRLFGVGVICVAAGLFGLIFVAFNLPPTYANLLKTRGVVNSIEKVSNRKAGINMHIVLLTDRGSLNIHANDYTTDLISESFVQKGDTVTIWIVKDNLFRDFYWVWQIERNSLMIMSYDQISNNEEQRRNSFMKISFGLSAIGILIVGIIIGRSKKGI